MFTSCVSPLTTLASTQAWDIPNSEMTVKSCLERVLIFTINNDIICTMKLITLCCTVSQTTWSNRDFPGFRRAFLYYHLQNTPDEHTPQLTTPLPCMQLTWQPCKARDGADAMTPPSLTLFKDSKSILTFSFPRVINFKFPLQPHQKYYITQYDMKNLAFHSILR